MKGILKRLAAWIVRHGLEEAQKELERRKPKQPTIPDTTEGSDVLHGTLNDIGGINGIQR